MTKKITLAAYLAGATTLAVSLPAMAEAQRDGLMDKGVQTPVGVSAKALPWKDDNEG